MCVCEYRMRKILNKSSSCEFNGDLYEHGGTIHNEQRGQGRTKKKKPVKMTETTNDYNLLEYFMQRNECSD